MRTDTENRLPQSPTTSPPANLLLPYDLMFVVNSFLPEDKINEFYDDLLDKLRKNTEKDLIEIEQKICFYSSLSEKFKSIVEKKYNLANDEFLKSESECNKAIHSYKNCAITFLSLPNTLLQFATLTLPWNILVPTIIITALPFTCAYDIYQVCKGNDTEHTCELIFNAWDDCCGTPLERVTLQRLANGRCNTAHPFFLSCILAFCAPYSLQKEACSNIKIEPFFQGHTILSTYLEKKKQYQAASKERNYIFNFFNGNQDNTEAGQNPLLPPEHREMI